MKYFKNTELAKLYHVSEKSVRNWIEATQAGKLDLQLHQEKNKFYVANVSKNIAIIKNLVQKGQKFKNTRGHKTISPSARFYQLYSRKQIVDIISNLEIHHEIPRQYNYFDGGAEYWDKFAWQMWNETTPNLLKSSVELLRANSDALALLLEGRKRVNVIDLGVGNCLPVRGLLGQLLEMGVLNKYVAVDISSDMLGIASRNIKDWFGDKVQFEGVVRDITYERFDDILVDDMLSKDEDRAVNIVLLLGATLMNFRSPYDVLKVIYGSMGHDDLLIYTDKPDTEVERRYFDINAGATPEELSPKYRFILDLLGIDPSLYEVEMGFDKDRLERYICIKLKVSITVEFEFGSGKRSISLHKDERILMWRALHQTTLDLVKEFGRVGFTLLQSSTTKDRQYLLTISGIDSSPQFGE